MANRTDSKMSVIIDSACPLFGTGLGKSTLFLGVFLLFLSGCYFDEAEEPLPPEGLISYSADVQPIFSNNCTACHPGEVENLDLSAGNSYASIIGVYVIPTDPEASVLYQRLLGNPSVMPPSGGLQDSEIQLIRLWIEQGAPNN